jgi:pimeloyl-ACP methyl ester carboxylesterase
MALVTPPSSWLTGTPSDVESLAEIYAERDALDGLAAMSADEPSTESDFQESFLRLAPASYAHWTETERAHASVGGVSLAAVSAWFTHIPDDACDRIRSMPLSRTLVIGGDRDLLTGVRPVRDYAATLGAELVLIADCGHYPWIEQPSSFKQILSPWLTAHNV